MSTRLFPSRVDSEWPHDLRIHTISQAEWRDVVDPDELATMTVERL